MEEFVKAIKKHECLWNPLHKHNRNEGEKDDAWQRIVAMNLDLERVYDVKSAKYEWTKLRTKHRDSIRRQKYNLAPKTWWLAREMEFLVPHIKFREKSSSTTEQFVKETEYDVKHSPIVMYLQPSYINQDKVVEEGVEDEGGEEEKDDDDEEEEEEQESKTSVKNNITDKARKRRADTGIIDIIKEVEKICQKRERHPVEFFFESMAQTTKALPTFLQNKIKKGVLEIVCQAEEEMECYNRTGHGNSSTKIKEEIAPYNNRSAHGNLSLNIKEEMES